MKMLKKVNEILSMLLLMCPGIMRVGGGFVSGGLPSFTYTGSYTLLDDGHRNWRIKFLSSGTLVFEKNYTIDIFCVGAGGGGITIVSNYTHGAGGGGYTNTYSGIVLEAGVAYEVVIGAGGARDSDGGTTWMINSSAYYANGGKHALRVLNTSSGTTGGDGGSGGAAAASLTGGEDGADGENSVTTPMKYGGTGQGTTTREFGDSRGSLYAIGGGDQIATGDNTGNGAYSPYVSGYSGICAIRNHRAA